MFLDDRIIRDGKSALDKAKELLEKKNLEKPAFAGKNSKLTKNSFASICSSTLVDKAKMVNISMGSNSSCISSNIDKMKKLEIDRMRVLHDEQPEIFLPTDIDYTLEDALEEHMHNNHENNSEEEDDSDLDVVHDSPESSCRFRKSGKNKYKKKNDRT
jgi:hypothetical protein